MEVGTPRPDTSRGVHEKVLRLLEEDGKTGSSIADLGCGEGALSLALKERGFKVSSCDVDAKFKVAGVPWVKFDLNADQGLPFGPGSFDYVACIEVIEHLHDPYHLIRRANGLLKPQGKLVLSMPNIISILSRINFALNGRFIFFEEGVLEHVNPIPYWELERGLVENGFEIERIAEGATPRSSMPLSVLRFLVKPKNTVLLCSNILLVKARKVAELPKDGPLWPVGCMIQPTRGGEKEPKA